MNLTRLPGSTWLLWLHNLPLRVGVLTGFYLGAVMVVSVLLATRMPFFDDLALIRNAASYVAFALVMLVPMLVFLRRPLQLFASGVVGWTLFSLAYRLMGFFFENLHTRLRPPFTVFAIGAIIYGVVAAAAWVVTMALEARQQPVIASRRRLP